MEFKINPYIVYVKIDFNNYIVAINSSAFMSDVSDWTKIDEGYGDKFYHAQRHYLPKSIAAKPGVWRYKLINSTPVECTAEEIAAQETLLPKPEQIQNPNLSVYDELEAAYNEGVNSI